MRTAVFASALVLGGLVVGCSSPITSVALSAERPRQGEGVTLLVSQPDVTGVEHVVAGALKDGGFEVYSASALPMVSRPGQGEEESELIRKFHTRYLCRVKTFGYGTYVRSFTIQLVNVETGRVVTSINGQDGTYAPREIARKLLASLR